MSRVRRILRRILLGPRLGLRAGLRRGLREGSGLNLRARLREGLGCVRREAAEAGGADEAGGAVGSPEPPPIPDHVAVLPVAELVEGRLVEAIVDGRVLVLVQIDGEVHALSGICPHAGGPLADGYVEGCILTCPLHGWTFDVPSGACHVDPTAALERWPVRVAEGHVYVRVVGGH